jgi:hypothetical protein
LKHGKNYGITVYIPKEMAVKNENVSFLNFLVSFSKGHTVELWKGKQQDP